MVFEIVEKLSFSRNSSFEKSQTVFQLMNKSLIVLKMFLLGVYSLIEILLFLTPKAVMGAHSPKAQITGRV